MANYYGTPNDFVEYCEERGYPIDGTLSPSPSEEIEQALLRASMYIDGKYRGRFYGTKAGGRSQFREWPRSDAQDASGEAIDYTEIPIEIEQATYEAAFREAQSPGYLLPDYVQTERVTSERVGPLAVSYADNQVLSAGDTYPVIGVIDGILAPLLKASSQSNLFGTSERI
jgi:hypothetical protein